MINAFAKLGFDSAMLMFESQQVIALRLAKLALGGPAAMSEANRMVSEKGIALAEAATHMAFGGSTEDVVRKVRRTVRANRKRLTRNH
ncbi:MAG: hypothetical protein BGP04_03815 [Rhizobiales bacterium 62-17]|jgi:hypothetical protein|nr:hypothetical protein [Methylocella sp. CPCC 101449]MBN9083313.1 hypothetical protein [Hyphomicrobiales bacterium]MDT2021975.1 hypothetical protein [Methylocella sp. CPCC 101449]OJY04520.1 MAG: hypothetical protein BGP04_03815 [Rhizobiales bacterium 62-17]HEV2572083.1 hypothetical protein [Beijerinckiaceae bacterium]